MGKIQPYFRYVIFCKSLCEYMTLPSFKFQVSSFKYIFQ
ncbi:Uncharacterized protein dnm_028370 [Desulfonema magnum]|uniref:Uncharacterized protein n=1 Tax=Desulfonema magnum TaxID=45655 RepID=A0A975BK29_9BACT|nr:Uncharacterized protein dnm_028370 [Desulfonema magnum]